MLQLQSVFKHAKKLGFGELHFKMDTETGLFAIIALHNITRGPALGGTRWLHYDNVNDAIEDSLRLARGMTYKSAICRLPHGGGKAVLIRPPKLTDRKKYFHAYAKFIEELGGNYITATDSGISPKEMDLISQKTRFVTSTSKIGDPGPFTARGVLRSIEAAVKVQLNKDSIKNLHIAIQGLGHVGYALAKECYKLGAKLIIADVNKERLAQAAKTFHAKTCSPGKIHAQACDIFAPCALGGILNTTTIPEIKASIVAGSANNQLEKESDGNILHRRGILYAPDFVINSGGLIQASGRYYGASDKKIVSKIDDIYDTLLTLFSRSKTLNKAPSVIADQLAIEMIDEEPKPWKK